jgi:flagellar biosynthetic protein FliP
MSVRNYLRSAPGNLALLLATVFLFLPSIAMAAEAVMPDLAITIGDSRFDSDGNIGSALKIVTLVSMITFLPGMILTMTCFTRIAVVLSMTRTALGTQSMPPNMVITGLALFLTFAVMGPVFEVMYDEGIKPYMDGQMSQEEALRKISEPMKKFLIAHSRDKDLALFLDITRTADPSDISEIPFHAAIPAFVISELNTAFQIGFLIALPFLVLDMVVSSILTSMSMITLPPVVISLPLKLMLFVIVDGWHLIIGSLVQSYSVVT